MKHSNHKAFGDFFVDRLQLCRPDLVSITMADVQHGDAKSDTSSEQVSISAQSSSEPDLMNYPIFRVMLITALWEWT